ncbi:hypothetical protein ACFV2U_44150 [Streptomyces sp. NPDC059697]|uniref:hypothetical protein n=1 Tax=Streptomyces sp. NPDC059697 TaxID=3346912 RepID=UPI003673DFF3
MIDNLRTIISFPVPGFVQVTAHVSFGTRKELSGLKPFFKEQRAWACEQPMASVAGMDRREAAARRGLWAEEKVVLRRQGRLIDSLDALVTGGLSREVEERGWNREWEACPRQAKAQGRSPGSPDGVWEEPVTVRLPADLVHTVYCACWHTSKDARDLLEKWQASHPKARPNRMSRPGCDAAALAEYQEIRSKIIHRGDIWRAAVITGIGNARAVQRPATDTE